MTGAGLVWAMGKGAEPPEQPTVARALRNYGSLEEMAQAEEVDTLLVQGARDYAIFAMEEDGTIATWNVGAQALAGYTPREVIGKPFAMLWTPEDRQAGKPERELAQAARGSADDENFILAKDGRRLWVNGVTRGLRDADGRFRGYVKVMRDASRRHQAEEQAKATQAQLKQFQGMVVHEIRNPLMPMLIHVELLQQTRLDEMQGRAVQALEAGLKRIQRLADDLADATRLDAGRFHVDREPMDLAAAAARASLAMGPVAQEQGVVLTTDCPEALEISGDPQRVDQVMHNLLANALRYTPPGGTVRVESRRVGVMACVSVIDTGVGLDEGQVAHLFQPFTQLNPDANRHGMGLGLFLSKAIVEALGGNLEAHSDGPGKGATFKVYLPTTDTTPSVGRGVAEALSSRVGHDGASRRRLHERPGRETEHAPSSSNGVAGLPGSKATNG